MPNFRRVRYPGGKYFFTVVTDQRQRFLCDPLARRLLSEAIELCRTDRPFDIDAMVLLPDHLHAIWTLPEGDHDYSQRWNLIKGVFTRQWLARGGCEAWCTEGRQRDGRRGVWQPKFWEHFLRDEWDYEVHFHYVHFNPKKHGLVEHPADWPYSTIHRWIREGVYPPDWGARQSDIPDFSALDTTAME